MSKVEPILSTDYWKQRLSAAVELHHAIFRCPLDKWRSIEEAHRKILAATIQPTDSILDAGCGWGRLLTLLPTDWKGRYVGVDLSPDFIDLAYQSHPNREFRVGDLRDLSGFAFNEFDWAIMISIRPMVKRNLSDLDWNMMEYQIRRVARRLLFLEYDETDPGSFT